MKTNLFKDNAFLDQAGTNLVGDAGFYRAIHQILQHEQVQQLSVNELRTLKCNLMKQLSDAFSSVITEKLHP